MLPQTPCPDTTDFQHLLDELLPQERQAALKGHLETCAGCRQALEALAGGGELAGAAARHLGRPSAKPGVALRRVMNELCGLRREVTPAAHDSNVDTALDFLDPPESPGHVGRLGRYEVIRVIGWGGMGVVLEAQDARLRRTVAIKVIAPALAANAEAHKRFLHEAQAVAAVRHEHVITIHAVEEMKGLPYLVMEYVPGLSLKERIKRTGPLEVKEVVRIGAQIASGLAAAHALGVIHRDIKPANILLERGSERVKITDFGLARAADHPRLTHSGVLIGTPEYMAPEQANGEAQDHRADLFSLGSVLYALCTGQSPFRAGTILAVLRRVSEDEPAPIANLNPRVPGWLVDVIGKLHAKSPTDRFQSAAEVAMLLGRHLAEPARRRTRAQELSGKTTGLVPRRRILWRWVAAGSCLMVFVAGLAGLAVLGVAAVHHFGGRSPDAPDAPGQQEIKAVPPVPEVKDPALRALLLDVKAANDFTRLAAAQKLENMEPIEAEREAVARALEPLINDPGHFQRQSLVRALGTWGTRESVPALVGMLEHKDVFTRKAAIVALGKLPDERGAEAVAGCLEDGQLRGDASQSLQLMGAVAEKAVAQRLDRNDFGIKLEACRILKVIGTKVSIPALQVAAQDTNGIVAAEAKVALQVIKNRK
jgi:hypothetical protein